MDRFAKMCSFTVRGLIYMNIIFPNMHVPWQSIFFSVGHLVLAM